MVTKEEVIQKLKTIADPEINIDIVSLGLVYDIDIDGENNDHVNIRMTLTTIGCPLAYNILESVKKAVESIEGVKGVDIYLTFDPPWSPDMMTEEAKKKLGYSTEGGNSA
jgi:metal-sulfur cluster biosynthetic enzyme